MSNINILVLESFIHNIVDPDHVHHKIAKQILKQGSILATTPYASQKPQTNINIKFKDKNHKIPLPTVKRSTIGTAASVLGT